MLNGKPQQGSPTFTGTQVNYYLVCPRKLWLFSHNITMEQTSELVELGRLVHEASYPRERKEIQIERIKIDFSGRDGVIHEINRKRPCEKSSSSGDFGAIGGRRLLAGSKGPFEVRWAANSRGH